MKYQARKGESVYPANTQVYLKNEEGSPHLFTLNSRCYIRCTCKPFAFFVASVTLCKIHLLKEVRTVKPQYNEEPRDWQNLVCYKEVVISRFFFMYVTIAISGVKKIVRYS